MSSSAAADDFGPTARWDVLALRAALMERVRAFFRQRQFLEVETPLLSADVVVDRHLDPFITTWAPDPARPTQGPRLYLQTSPEFAMKRLLAAGAPAIFQVTKAFRNGERSPRHNPEFTLVEWYRPGDDLQAGMELLAELAEVLFDETSVFSRAAAAAPHASAKRQRSLEPPHSPAVRCPATERLSYAEAFRRYVGLDPHRASHAELAAAAARRGVPVPESLSADDRDSWLQLLLGELVEPHLGQNQPTILYDYPAGQAALARTRGSDPPVAERFELYVHGMELANGYHELLDPEVLLGRTAEANRERRADGKSELPASSRLLTAMRSGLPPCAGAALGFDRVVMLVAGAAHIDDVLTFPIDRA